MLLIVAAAAVAAFIVVNSGGLGSQSPDFWMGIVGDVMGSPLNIIIFFNVQGYEMRTLSKV